MYDDGVLGIQRNVSLAQHLVCRCKGPVGGNDGDRGLAVEDGPVVFDVVAKTLRFLFKDYYSLGSATRRTSFGCEVEGCSKRFFGEAAPLVGTPGRSSASIILMLRSHPVAWRNSVGYLSELASLTPLAQTY
ncbi:hypothetical protein SprV_0200900300 [Sparganum proliferum]